MYPINRTNSTEWIDPNFRFEDNSFDPQTENTNFLTSSSFTLSLLSPFSSSKIVNSEEIQDSALTLSDNFGKGVCTATEKAGKQFKLFIHNPELSSCTLHFGNKFPIFQKGQWPGTEGVNWLNVTLINSSALGDNDFFLDIEVLGIPTKKHEKAVHITYCTSGQCRSSKSSDRQPVCLFTKKDAIAIKFNNSQPFIPIGFRCAPSYHDCEYFILRIVLTNATKTRSYSCDYPVYFLHFKSKSATTFNKQSETLSSFSQTSSFSPFKPFLTPNPIAKDNFVSPLSPECNSSTSGDLLKRPCKRSRTNAELDSMLEESTLPSTIHLHRLTPTSASPMGGTWISIEGTGFTNNSLVFLAEDNQPLESYLLAVSNSRLLFQTPPGKAGQKIHVFVSDGINYSNTLIIEYQMDGNFIQGIKEKNPHFLILFFQKLDTLMTETTKPFNKILELVEKCCSFSSHKIESQSSPNQVLFQMLFEFIDNVIKLDPREGLNCTKTYNVFQNFLLSFHEIFPPYKNTSSPKVTKISSKSEIILPKTAVLPKSEIIPIPKHQSNSNTTPPFSLPNTSFLSSPNYESLIKQTLVNFNLTHSIVNSNQFKIDTPILGKGFSSVVNKGKNFFSFFSNFNF